MKKQALSHPAAVLKISLATVMTIAILAACNPNQTEPSPPGQDLSTRSEQWGPTTVISTPANGQQFELGQKVEVQSESVDQQGIVRLELLIDEQIVSSSEFVPQPESVFVARQTWLPEEPGSHSLQVRAYNPANVLSQSQKVIVEVIPATLGAKSDTLVLSPTPLPPQTESSPTPSPPITPSPTSPPITPTEARAYLKVNVNPGLNIRQGPSIRYNEIGFLPLGETAEIVGQGSIGDGIWWQIRYKPAPDGLAWVSANLSYAEAHNIDDVPTVTPPPTPSPPSPTATPTPPPAEANIQFGADRTQIRGGECVTFFWNVTQAKEVYFQGQGVAGADQARRECPFDTQSYELRVVNRDGTVETRNIVIQVEGGGYRTVEMEEGDGVDFDKDGRVSGDDGDDFEWVETSGEWRFRKWDDDDDLELVPVGPVDSLADVGKEDCDWALDNLDDEDYIKPFPALAACIRTDDGRMGKIRFQDDEGEIDIEWALW